MKNDLVHYFAELVFEHHPDACTICENKEKCLQQCADNDFVFPPKKNCIYGIIEYGQKEILK